MNNICTWFCADEKGEESIFPQSGKKSSSLGHQYIYWRCILVFFITSRRYNKFEKHILFTNTHNIPVVDGVEVRTVLKDLQVEVVVTDFKYKTPKGYYSKFQNQFYEFSILEHIASEKKVQGDLYFIADSDCIFIKPIKDLFDAASLSGFFSVHDNVAEDYIINGLSRNNLKNIYEELLNKQLTDVPQYHLGEFLLCNVKNIAKIFNDFKELWPVLLKRFEAGLPKFNEEAHTLSYLYYKNGLQHTEDNVFMKRIWTNPLFYRNVTPTDTELAVWHLPAEKNFGIYTLYKAFMHKLPNYGLDLTDSEYLTIVQGATGVPKLTRYRHLKYYVTSYYRALAKRIAMV